MAKISAHPVYRLPSPAEAMAMGAERWTQFVNDRERRIWEENNDPLRYGWVSPIWKVCWALLNYTWGISAEWAEAMRAHLGFARPVKSLLINGGQRGSKSEFAARTGMMVLCADCQEEQYQPRRAWFFHQNANMSVEYQQPLMRRYLPAELREKEIKSRTTYISYKAKTGFSEGRFILPWMSDCSFRSYEMDKRTIEGGNVDFIGPDELVPSDWVETMELRVAERAGRIVVTFTPIDGYTDTVRMFQDGAMVVKRSTGYLLPTDGGEPDVGRAMGLTEAEVQERQEWLDGKRAAPSVWGRPERCEAWLEERQELPEGTEEMVAPGAAGWPWGVGYSQPRPPQGRTFEQVPRVMRSLSKDSDRAVVFFHSSDNPYGNPLSVWRTVAKGSRGFHKERFYGIATKMQTTKCPRFDRAVHVVPESAVPQEGRWYQIVDPCSGRNFFCLWVVETEDADFVADEWPNQVDQVEGVGVMGHWAVPSGKRVDGDRGPAQRSLGWGLLQYKLLFARMEGWELVEDWEEAVAAGAPDWEIVRRWNERCRKRRDVLERFIDSRFANTKVFDLNQMLSLIDQFDEVGLTFIPTTGGDSNTPIQEGAEMINNALFWDPEKPRDWFNRPHLFISERCRNLIYAMENYTGESQASACKDPFDDLRYYYLKGLGWRGARGQTGNAVTAGRGAY